MSGNRSTRSLVVAGVAAAAIGTYAPAALSQAQPAALRFAVAGDSRNCGDVVMPAIAAGAAARQASFYWHLGDARWTANFDEDMTQALDRRGTPLTITSYLNLEWDDFIAHQIAPFGGMPFFLGIGNHETVQPKTREQFLLQFADWLDTPVLQAQRLRDDPNDRKLRAYYHWIDRGVDFIYVDNATADQFDSTQMQWFGKVLARAKTDPSIKSIVVGTHQALPESLSYGHSMNGSAAGEQSGRQMYQQLLEAQNTAGKHVYVLSTHAHFYMDGIYNTEYWRTHGGVLPGWIAGTAGAVRHALPPGRKDARQAETDVYGYLLGTVLPTGEIQFEFQHIDERSVPPSVTSRYKPEFVHWCFAENKTAEPR